MGEIYIPGSDIAVDKCIVRYIAKSLLIITIPNKPTLTGVTVMTGNHCANNQKDPYVSTAHIPAELTYIVCTVTTGFKVWVVTQDGLFLR